MSGVSHARTLFDMCMINDATREKLRRAVPADVSIVRLSENNINLFYKEIRSLEIVIVKRKDGEFLIDLYRNLAETASVLAQEFVKNTLSLFDK